MTSYESGEEPLATPYERPLPALAGAGLLYLKDDVDVLTKAAALTNAEYGGDPPLFEVQLVPVEGESAETHVRLVLGGSWLIRHRGDAGAFLSKYRELKAEVKETEEIEA